MGNSLAGINQYHSDSSYESEDSFEKPEVGTQTLGLRRKEPVKVEKFTSSHIERLRVKFDFSNVESMGQPVRPPSFVIEGFDNADDIEPAEPKPLSERTDFSKACHFPVQYLTDQAGSTDDVEEEPIQPVEKKVEKRRETGASLCAPVFRSQIISCTLSTFNLHPIKAGEY